MKNILTKKEKEKKKKKNVKRVESKVMVVGDGGSGKTSLIATYATGEFPVDYIPTVFENTNLGVEVKGTKIGGKNVIVDLEIWDTAGQEGYDRLRPLLYFETDVVILCYSIANPDSFENVKSSWIPEIRFYLPNAPIILVGCQSDVRGDLSWITQIVERGQEPVTFQQVADFVKEECPKENIFAVLETSALRKEGLEELFNTIALASIQQHRKNKSVKRKLWGSFFNNFSAARLRN